MSVGGQGDQRQSSMASRGASHGSPRTTPHLQGAHPTPKYNRKLDVRDVENWPQGAAKTGRRSVENCKRQEPRQGDKEEDNKSNHFGSFKISKPTTRPAPRGGAGRTPAARAARRGRLAEGS